jgi:hypothetical protein
MKRTSKKKVTLPGKRLKGIKFKMNQVPKGYELVITRITIIDDKGRKRIEHRGPELRPVRMFGPLKLDELQIGGKKRPIRFKEPQFGTLEHLRLNLSTARKIGGKNRL